MRDRFEGAPYVVGRPSLPELSRLDPDLVTPEVLATFREGAEYPKKSRGVIFNYGNIRLITDRYGRPTYDEDGQIAIEDLGFRQEVEFETTAEDADRMNMQAIRTAWDSSEPGPLFLPCRSPEFTSRHLGYAHKVYIGLFERAVRRVRGLSNDVWHYQPPTIQYDLEATLIPADIE